MRDAGRLPGRLDRQGSLIVIGPTPPPIHGSAFTNMHVVEAVRRNGRLAAHLETGEDLRPVFTTGKFDPTNVYYGLKHAAQLLGLLLRRRGAAVWVPISQNRWGFARDAVFVWLARGARRRVLIHLNGGLFAEFYASSPAWQRRLIRRTIGAVAEAWVLTEAHRPIFGGMLPPERVRVLENTSEDIGLAAEATRSSDGDGRVRVLYLANLIPEKGYGDLIEAIELLIERGVGGIELRLVGEVQDEEARRLRERARRLAERDVSLEVVGPLMGERKFAEYHWADIFAFPSRYPPEGQPLVLLEAMSAGLPILSTDHSGIPYTVLDGEQGLIVPPGDIEAIAEALGRLIAEPALRERLGAGGRARYEQLYRPECFYDAVERLLADPV